ncbi:hypothetical protein CDAR_484161 [Caerostris darwini]|uniref:Uncharacterized protein n=1 Tax=Caerostris darwini TaxID=1538125 RepID=A0AAV4T6D1_9ARAC|nr:hypothetical protein CDAR_484161 [Caerostris darwini]
MFISKGTTERSTIVTLRWPGQSFLHPGLHRRGVDHESKRQVFRIVLLHHLPLAFVPSCLLRKMSRQKHSPRYDPELTPSGSSTSHKNSDHPRFSWEIREPWWVIDKLLPITLSDFDGLCAVGGKCFQYC